MKLSRTEIKVRYAETDQMGVVYHANYIIWFEIGRTAIVEEIGFDYAKMEEEGLLSPVLDVNATFKKPVRYGEKAYVLTWIEKYDGLRVTYGYEVRNGNDELCVSGFTSHAVVKKESFRPVSIRRALPDWHRAYEEAKKK